MPEQARSHIKHAQNGLIMAFFAYIIWGLLPLYLRQLHDIAPVEFVGWRIISTVPVCTLLILITRQTSQIWAILRSPKLLGLMTLSALLIGGNWLIYIFAVQQNHIFAASIGYYINPLVNVLLGTLFMGEKLSRRGWLAVGLATLGVTVLIWGALDTLSISLSLAATFALYGMVRKLSPVESLPGLTMETALLLLPAVLWLVHLSGQNTGTSLHHHPNLIWLTALSGIVTATPLLLFAAAARRMDYSTLGFIQYISPTLAFLLGIFVFHEHLRPIQLLSFVIIWAALGIFIWDMLAKKSTT